MAAVLMLLAWLAAAPPSLQSFLQSYLGAQGVGKTRPHATLPPGWI